MKGSFGRGLIIMLMMGWLSARGWASALSEVEPNNLPAQAQDLGLRTGELLVDGSLASDADVDYYRLTGIGGAWGVVAFVEGSNARAMRLSALAADGVTVLQQDMGSWQGGSLLGGLPFQGADEPLYLKVEGASGDYRLRVLVLFMKDEGEIEPNDAPDATATVVSTSNLGALETDDPQDCYRFGAQQGDVLEVIINGDPDATGEGGDLGLALYDAQGALLETVDQATAGGNEYLSLIAPGDGPFGVCVSRQDQGNARARYRILTLINGWTYAPKYELTLEWLNPGINGSAQVDDQLDFRLSLRNQGQVPIPGIITLSTTFTAPCLMATADAPFDLIDHLSGQDRGDRQFDAPLGVNETLSVEFSLWATQSCQARIQPSMALNYYFLSVGGSRTTIPLLANACQAAPYLLSGEVAGEGYLEYQSQQRFVVDDGSGQGDFWLRSPRRLRLVAPELQVPASSTLTVEQGAEFAFNAAGVETCP